MKLNEALYKGEDRGQGTLPPERLGDYVAGDDAVRVVEAVFLNALLKMLKGDYKASNASCLPVFLSSRCSPGPRTLACSSPV